MNKNVEKSLRLAKDKRANVKKRQCYYNAFKAVQYVPEYAEAVYVEGIAVFREGLPIEHGWIECDGEIIDPTLPTEDLLYFPGLRCEGQLGISKIMVATESVGVPLFYAFGWGGRDLPGFQKARRLALEYADALIAQASPNFPTRAEAICVRQLSS